jgi:hypothetical protein
MPSPRVRHPKLGKRYVTLDAPFVWAGGLGCDALRESCLRPSTRIENLSKLASDDRLIASSRQKIPEIPSTDKAIRP